MEQEIIKTDGMKVAASFPDVSLFLWDKSAQRTMGMGKGERHASPRLFLSPVVLRASSS